MLGTKVREKDTLTAEFWDGILDSAKFQEFVKSGYSIGGGLAEIELDLEVAWSMKKS